MPTLENMGSCEDGIEDDYDSFDELFTQYFTEGNSLERALSMSPLHCQGESRTPRSGVQRSTYTTRRFILSPAHHSESSVGTIEKEDALPWAQQYPPLNLEELAVHKKKVHDVEHWLNHALAENSHNRLLVLRGPAGSGKTTTISLLSNKLKFNILEWKTPSVSKYSMKDYVPLAAQFDEFLNRGNIFEGLDLGEATNATDLRGNKSCAPQRRIILIEEFPTLSGQSFSTLATFRLTLQRYISAAPQRFPTPIVIIISETFTGSGPSLSESFTAHRLLGREICTHPSTTMIDFNEIAPTFMYKALNLVLEKDARYFKRHKSPSTSILKAISKSGDIRNAVASLEFICLADNKSAAHQPKPKKSARTSGSLTATEKETLKIITKREANLGLFHAVGKIIYNKRDDYAPGIGYPKLPSPPSHLNHCRRPKISQVSVNELVDEIGADKQTYISALHENYVLSCSSDSFTEYLDECIKTLSDSDVLCVDQKNYGRNQTGAGLNLMKSNASVDLLRQDDISYQVATRGLLFALPYPVKRQMSTADNSNGVNDPHKIFTPSTIRRLRDMQEIQCLVNSWASRLLFSSNGQAMGPVAGLNAFDLWGNVSMNRKSSQDSSVDTQPATITMISRRDLILHQLPYMVALLKDSVPSRELGKITGYSILEKCKPGSGQYELEADIVSAGLEAQECKGFILSDDDIIDD